MEVKTVRSTRGDYNLMRMDLKLCDCGGGVKEIIFVLDGIRNTAKIWSYASVIWPDGQ